MWKLSSLALLLLAPAHPSLERFERVESHMGTTVRMVAYAPDQQSAEQAFRPAFVRIAELDRMLSDYKPDSELNRVSRTAWRRPERVSPDLFRVLELSQQIARETDGTFDITLGPLIQLWRASRRAGRLPDKASIEKAQSVSGYRRLRLDPKAHTVQLDKPGMQLDVGGIAKGYAAQQALSVLRREGSPRAMVAVSGDLALGDPPPGRPGWKVGIDPFSKGGSEQVLELSRCSVSTSGDSEQFVEIDGVRYSHIVDPSTGLGLRDQFAVTVISPEGALADAFATAISVVGEQRSKAWLKRHPGTRAIVFPRPARN